MKTSLTEGSVFKNIVFFSLPYLLSYFLQTLYGMADLIIIGRFNGVAETTAVSVGSQVMHMLTVMIVGLAMGTTVCIGHAVGKNDRREEERCIGNTVTLFALLSVVVTAVLLLLVKPIVAVMSTPAEAASGTEDYLTVCFSGIPFITAYNVISSVYRGLGDSKSPMYFIAVACAANIVLDLVFIGVFKMGAAGAALGTTLSQLISVLISLKFFKGKTGGAFKSENLKPNRTTAARIIKIGLPVAAQDGLIQIAFIVITVIANSRGLNDAAAVGIVEKIISFVFLVPSSLLSAVSAIGAQNIGAGKPRRAQLTLRYAVFTALGFGVAVSLIMQFAASAAVGLFTKDSAVISAGREYLKGYIFDCIFAGIHFSFSGYFCACGKSWLSFLHNITAIALVRIPWAYLTLVMFPSTLYPMGLATAAGSLVSVIICIAAYAVLTHKKGNEKENEL